MTQHVDVCVKYSIDCGRTQHVDVVAKYSVDCDTTQHVGVCAKYSVDCDSTQHVDVVAKYSEDCVSDERCSPGECSGSFSFSSPSLLMICQKFKNASLRLLLTILMYADRQSNEHRNFLQNSMDQLVQWTIHWQIKFNMINVKFYM